MKKDVLLFKIACVLFGISAFSILLSFLGDYNGNIIAVVFAVLTGALFWAGLVLGIVLLFLVNRHRKRYEKNGQVNYRIRKRRIGVSAFLSNKLAAIADIAMAILFIITLVTMFIPVISENITVIFVAFLLFSMYMHCMLNGVNFIYIKSIDEECKK